jgi:Mn-dependent DtxR family transcriptional regulator
MGRNLKGTPGYSLSNARRKRKRIELTLSPDVIERLDELARIHGSKSAAVEALVRATPPL